MRATFEEKRKWWNDIANHPDSPLINFYTAGRCQEPDQTCCPYCGNRQEPLEYEQDHETYCNECDMPYRVSASFGYGYSSYPLKCKHGHLFVFSSQYFYKDENWRVFDCICCEKSSVKTTTDELLPWLPEYDNPEYFDPDGVLDTGRSLQEQIEARLNPPKTPVLDILSEPDFYYRTTMDRFNAALKALESSK
jgi:hypothetical protein